LASPPRTKGALHGEADLAAVGALLADRTRATFLLTLVGGGLTSASALAARAEVSPSQASNHLRRLSEGGLVVAERRGRQRMYRLASASIAEALEALMPLAPTRQEQSLRGVRARDGLRRGRLCYDHLAGRVAVAIATAMIERDWLAVTDDGYQLTGPGIAGLGEVGIDIPRLATRPRPLTRACLDWSEQQPHLAGSAGAAITAELFRRGWLEAREASRVVSVTEEGRAGLRAWLGIEQRLLELPDESGHAA
jgi:DNA-binding transcriptional ArsR family regulator